MSDGLELVGRLAEPTRREYGGRSALVICHGFPTPSNGSQRAGHSYYELADRIADRLGWYALAFTYRGCGQSEGNFSLSGWLSDVKNAVLHLHELDEVDTVWIAGFGTGGVLAMRAAAEMDAVAGVVGVAPPADFDDWAQDPGGLLAYARRVGAVSDENFPEDFDAWSEELSSMRGVSAAEAMAHKPLLVLHGAADQVVPVFDARVVADAHGSADLRIISGAAHRLRFDPRAVAVLMGWLDRSGTAIRTLPEPDEFGAPPESETDTEAQPSS